MTRRREEQWPLRVHLGEMEFPGRRFVWYPGDIRVIRADHPAPGVTRWSADRVGVEDMTPDIPWRDQDPIIPVSLDICWRCDEARIPRDDPVGLCPPCAEHLRNLTSPAAQIEDPAASEAATIGWPTGPEAERFTAWWVCTDCYLAHHFGARLAEGPEGPDRWLLGPDFVEVAHRDPLQLLPEDADISDWTNVDTGEGIAEFSWVNCEGCGSNLGGQRYRLHVTHPHLEIGVYEG